MKAARPAMVPVRLRDLRLNEEFETSLTRQHGVVVGWGWVLDVEPRTGRATRVRAVKVRFGTVERVFSAELVVLVPYDRPHARHEGDDRRWNAPLSAGAA